jgi:DNA-binding transcriptional ArsR family regulator
MSSLKKYDLSFIQALLGETAAMVLLYINRFSDSYATEIAQNFSYSQQTAQYNLVKLERAGILSSRFVGKTRLYRINPRYVLSDELSRMLDKALEYLPEEIAAEYFTRRTRPRTKGKPLRRYRETRE